MEDTVRIRPGTAEDVAALQEIERRAASLFAPFSHLGGEGEGCVPSETLCVAAAAGRLHVAVLDQTPVGWCYTTVVDGRAHLAELDVHPAHGRRGIGTRLIEHMADRARREGFDAVSLTTFREVPFNAPMYRRRGFEELASTSWGPGLRSISEEEAAHGMPPTVRCAMVRWL